MVNTNIQETNLLLDNHSYNDPDQLVYQEPEQDQEENNLYWSDEEENENEEDGTNQDLDIYHTVSVSSLSSNSFLNSNEVTHYSKIGIGQSSQKQRQRSSRFKSTTNLEPPIFNNLTKGSFKKSKITSHTLNYFANTFSSNTKINHVNNQKLDRHNIAKRRNDIIGKFNKCIELFNESNNTSKNYSYRRFILVFIYKTYKKILKLKPNSQSCADMLAKSAEDMYNIFKYSIKQCPLEYLSTSFFYQLGNIYINGIGMKKKLVDEGIGYLILGKFSCFKFLGNGSLVNYFRKYKIDFKLLESERYRELVKEMEEVKAQKGVKVSPQNLIYYPNIEKIQKHSKGSCYSKSNSRGNGNNSSGHFSNNKISPIKERKVSKECCLDVSSSIKIHSSESMNHTSSIEPNTSPQAFKSGEFSD
eukprot:CAMPEP_0170539364 /NCGR_PEP_ID=MMETSP0209-20121228/103882_1 /TAXON_ID=665100 ORGANISM="Litonotus pictus, Strain P1" /NCGR_SAMPLE_ID=MMETSP0209 /ASSEMBLY_ACC=CAM_ASM_000301 /LENGTH=415 /DNA_ID=CAMNT_0010841269 /DNA_START=436 /DNA_END=1682 /DNA_ORIENTATION=-